MHPRDLAQVAFRVLAVYLGILSIPAIAKFGEILATKPDFGIYFTLGLLLGFLPLAIAVLLWVLAPLLAKFAASDSEPADSAAKLTPRDLTRSGLIILGAYFFLSTFPAFLTHLLALVDEKSASQISAIYIMQLAITCILGAALILGADRISLLGQKIRYAGPSK